MHLIVPADLPIILTKSSAILIEVMIMPSSLFVCLFTCSRIHLFNLGWKEENTFQLCVMHFVPGKATIESSQCVFCLQELFIAVQGDHGKLRILIRRSARQDMLVIHYSQIAYLRLTTEVLS